MRGAVDKSIHSRLVACGIFKFQIVPLPAAAREHGLAIENAAIGRVSRNHAPLFAVPRVAHAISRIDAPSTEMCRGGILCRRGVKRKPSIFAWRNRPPLLRSGRRQHRPIARNNLRKVPLPLLRRGRQTDEADHDRGENWISEHASQRAQQAFDPATVVGSADCCPPQPRLAAGRYSVVRVQPAFAKASVRQSSLAARAKTGGR